MKAVIMILAVFAIILAIQAIPVANNVQPRDDCTVENCSKFCQSIDHFGGLCIGSLCQCYDL
ncbi:hypothetical protein NQ317_010161 [Molorchus minor]|uniref:Uncharacterized protein n=1 Tax=Molorchus minor TaxID=1323400 RepID=A0ABQ9JGC5_9CUCU|nr:hypothetical protein NQ317_010161 [Molorchus minor]